MKKLLFLIVCIFCANITFATDYLLIYKWKLSGSDLYSTTENNTNVVTRKINQKGYVYGYFDNENLTWSNLKLLKFWKDKAEKQYYYTIEPFMYGAPDIILKELAKGDIWEFACVGESLKSEIMKKSFKISDNLELRVPKKFRGMASWSCDFNDGSISVGSAKVTLSIDSKKTKDYFDIGSFTTNELISILGLDKYNFKELNAKTSRYGSTIIYLSDAIFETLGVGTSESYYLFPKQAGSPGELMVWDDTGNLVNQPISSRDSYLLSRGNHYGTQAASTISDFDVAASKATQVLLNKATLDGLNIPEGVDLSDISTRLGITEGVATGAGTQAGANKTTLDNLNIPVGFDATDIKNRLGVTEGVATGANTAAATAQGTANTNATNHTALALSLKPVAKTGSYPDLTEKPNTPNPWTSQYTLVADMTAGGNVGASKYFTISSAYAADGSFIFGIPPSSGNDDVYLILPPASSCDVNDSLKIYFSKLTGRNCYIQIGTANENPPEYFFNMQENKHVYQLRTADVGKGEFAYATFHVIPNPADPTKKIWFFHDASDTEWDSDRTLPVNFNSPTSGSFTPIDNTINFPKGINTQ